MSLMKMIQLLARLITNSRLRGPIRRRDVTSSLCDKWLRRYWTVLVEPWMMGRYTRPQPIYTDPHFG
jgi:hypothetical protein